MGGDADLDSEALSSQGETDTDSAQTIHALSTPERGGQHL